MPKWHSPVENFWEKVEQGNGCWLWKGKLDPRSGYGSAFWEGRKTGAHRLSYILNRGTILDGLYLLHKCNTPLCVNPAHLYTGTQKDNVRDQLEAGTYCHRGSENYQTHLTEEDIPKIRNSLLTRKELAVQYGVSYAAVCDIITNRSWKHVK